MRVQKGKDLRRMRFNLILQTQADVWNTFCLRESGCVFPVGEGNGDFFVEEFGGQKV